MLPADSELAFREWSTRQVEEGLRQAEAGEFATEDDLSSAYARWRPSLS